MDWSISLEEQAAVRSSLANIATSEIRQKAFFGDDRRGILPYLRASLTAACDGEAIFVEPEICRALAQEADNVPEDWMLTADTLIAIPAFCWLGEPVGYARMVDGAEIPLIGYSWAVMKDSNDIVGPNIMALGRTNFTYPLAWL